MTFVVVPDYVSDAIYKKVDEAIAKVPEAISDREYFYGVLLDYFDAYGELPDTISIEAKL